ncbi:MAG: alkaline phosphatase family protein [Bacillota bacterium]|jgi:arylsulfatase A-like enzyme|nr:alkaline phosphatase family protein [Bacillota bacterium]
MANKVLLIIMDGLRPDMISRETMPFVHSTIKQGVEFTSNFASFPSKTRIASAVLATGCYPGRNGIMNNGLYFPALGGAIGTKDYEDLQRLHQSPAGPVLAVPTLAERLVRAGRRVAIATAFSTGGTYLQDPEGYGVSVNHSYIYPAANREMLESRFGKGPAETLPDVGRNQYAVRVLTEYMLPELKPDFAVLWLSEPDRTQHKHDLGSPTVNQALRLADDCVRQVVDALDDYGLLDSTDLFLMSDHGFISSDPAAESVTDNAIRWLSTDASPEALVVNFNSIYIQSEAQNALQEIVTFLQQQEGIGPIFSARPLEGVLPYSLLKLDHERSPDLFFFPRWSPRPNDYGVLGMCPGYHAHYHGAGSPYELLTTMLCVGPSFKQGEVVRHPTGVIDVVPTVLHLLGLEVDSGIDGRVLAEAFRDGRTAADLQVHEFTYRSQLQAGDYSYEAYAKVARVDNTYYLKEANGAVHFS